MDVSANAVFDYRLELEPKILSTKVDLDGNKKWYADPIKKIELSVEDFEFGVPPFHLLLTLCHFVVRILLWVFRIDKVG